MVRTCACLLLSLLAAPAYSQSTYVAGSVGASTPLLTRIESSAQRLPDTGTALALGVRAGLGLGGSWGAELEFSNALEVTGETRSRGGQFGPSSTLATGLFSLQPGIITPSLPTLGLIELTVRTNRRDASLNPVLWFSHPLTDRIELSLLGGVSFDRTAIEERYQVVVPNLGGFSISVAPQSVHVVQYHVGVLAGVETRLAFGDHARVIPGVRLNGLNGGWAVRPSVAVGWFF